MIYNGQDDIICNTPCTENFIDKLDTWAGQDDFRGATRYPWTENNNTVGMYKTGGNLTFVVVNKAGHMVPKDQLYNSIQMMQRWVNGTGFGEQ